jgi:hypothetical protein
MELVSCRMLNPVAEHYDLRFEVFMAVKMSMDIVTGSTMYMSVFILNSITILKYCSFTQRIIRDIL